MAELARRVVRSAAGTAIEWAASRRPTWTARRWRSGAWLGDTIRTDAACPTAGAASVSTSASASGTTSSSSAARCLAGFGPRSPTAGSPSPRARFGSASRRSRMSLGAASDEQPAQHLGERCVEAPDLSRRSRVAWTARWRARPPASTISRRGLSLLRLRGRTALRSAGLHDGGAARCLRWHPRRNHALASRYGWPETRSWRPARRRRRYASVIAEGRRARDGPCAVPGPAGRARRGAAGASASRPLSAVTALPPGRRVPDAAPRGPFRR